jgi:hypothetical protein
VIKLKEGHEEHNDEKLLDEFEEGNKELEQRLAKSKEDAHAILKKYFKSFYEVHGNRWAKENDDDMDSLLNAIMDMAACESLLDVRLAFFEHEEE